MSQPLTRRSKDWQFSHAAAAMGAFWEQGPKERGPSNPQGPSDVRRENPRGRRRDSRGVRRQLLAAPIAHLLLACPRGECVRLVQRTRWGLHWQITPRVLTEALAAGGAEAKRAFAAMMPMKKIDVAAIEAARRG